MNEIDSARARAEAVARQSYGRLLALLAAPNGDIQAAEDALGDAFVAALTTWPERGLPKNPEGWLLTVARNRLRDLWRSAAWRTTATLPASGDDGWEHEVGTGAGGSGRGSGILGAGPASDNPLEQLDRYLDGDALPDKRLELLFVCAHPAIDPRIHTPLMLQSVLGFEASQIAAAFAVSETSMAQRLVRAKRRIRDARIPFVIPGASDLPARLPPVLEAIYGAYAIDWLSPMREEGRLDGEALYLATVLAELMPEQPEALGLAALLSFSAARAPARLTPEGEPIGLDEQNTALWDSALITQGERLLRRAHAAGSIGRFQLEAAIQSAHADRARSGTVDWAALATLHRALVRISPTLGARVALAATLGEAESPEQGLAALAHIDDAEHFQPAWATRAYLLARCGRIADARHAYAEAITLTAAPNIRAQLELAAARLP